MTDQPMTYAGSGVNYAAMDPVKVKAQEVGRSTARHLERFGFCEVPESRGESVYLIEGEDHYLAFIVEGLGTKNLVADAMWHVLGRYGYQKAAQDAVAMIVNDMITLGALPMVIGQYLAVGSDRWFANQERSGGLTLGWAQACDQVGASYGCGETPTLRDIIYPTAADIAGASLGIIKPKDRRIDPLTIQSGDAIVILASSGVHANGLTLIRDLSDLVSYKTPMDDGRMFGEAVLDPTHLYVPVIEAVLDAGIRPHYGVNITGHGWRKLMRTVEPFVYVIERIPEPQPVFGFIQRHGQIDEREMYGNYNMGAGFALYVDPKDADKVIKLSLDCGIGAHVAGYIEKRGNEKKVVIEPKGLEYDGSTLSVR
jgi:phosphoribosylformylglycinamidine cyclo-ligase